MVSLRKSKAYFRTIVENSHDGIVMLDDNRKTLYVSPSYTRINNYTPREMDTINELITSLAHSYTDHQNL